MENKLNLIEILRDCPRGMELNCTLCDNVVFEKIDFGLPQYPIVARRTETNTTIYLTEYGQYSVEEYYKCIIFPKGKTTWEGFVPPHKFKDGDVVAAGCSETTQLFLLKHVTYRKDGHVNTGYCYFGWDFYYDRLFEEGDWGFSRLATEEEKAKLFDTIKANGYKWDEETKTLEKLAPKPKFKEGDIVATKSGLQVFILQRAKSDTKGYCYIGYDFEFNEFFDTDEWEFDRLATEEEKEKLFQAIKATNCKWNPETKTLEKIVPEFVPKFKVGDRIVHKVYKDSPFTITEITNECYKGGTQYAILIEQQDNFELVPNKFDINSLVPFESRVLVRDYSYEVWRVSFWGCLVNNECGFIYDTTRGCYKQCIPYEGNEHLLGKTDCCNDFYKNWK